MGMSHAAPSLGKAVSVQFLLKIPPKSCTLCFPAQPLPTQSMEQELTQPKVGISHRKTNKPLKMVAKIQIFL